MKKLFDSHTHLLDGRLADSRDELLDEVEGLLCVYSPDEDIKEFAGLLSKDKVLGSAGIHPHDADSPERMWPMLEKALGMRKVAALGEVGLDFHYLNSPAQIQREVFKKQLKIARDKNLPVIIHSRDAFEETLALLDETPPPRAVIHCFGGSQDQIKQYLDRDFYIGIGGVVTFKNSADLKEAVREAPLEKILLETDCPYLAPVPRRGRTNRPAYLKYIAAEVGSLKGKRPEEIASQTYKNALSFFSTD